VQTLQLFEPSGSDFGILWRKLAQGVWEGIIPHDEAVKVVDFVLENARHEPREHHFVVLAFQVLEDSLDLHRALDQAHLVVVADAPLPPQTHVVRESRDARVKDRLERLVLARRVPILSRAHQKQVHIWLAHLGGSDAHAFSLPESSGVSEAILAHVDGEERLFAKRKLFPLHAPLQQHIASFLEN